MNRFEDWNIGDTFWYLVYLENRVDSSELGRYVVRRSVVARKEAPSAIYSDEFAASSFHYTDITPSEQHAWNIASKRNTLLSLVHDITL